MSKSILCFGFVEFFRKLENFLFLVLGFFRGKVRSLGFLYNVILFVCLLFSLGF